MDEIVEPKVGLQTGDNTLFLRQWFEVSLNNIKFDAKSIDESISSNKKWFPYNKGGSYRKWYGNYDYVVNWENNGAKIRNFKFPNGKQRSVVRNPNYYFRETISWSLITSGGFSIRYRKPSSLPDIAAPFITGLHEDLLYLLGIMNSPVGNYIFKILNPTINLSNGVVANFPVVDTKREKNFDIIESNLNLTTDDWDSFETSWDFIQHPLLSKIDEHNR
ncbi:restriction endonuclease subunit M, partial [Leuconostoc sp. S51]|nr:restriction endonuclease subunit M [Leuconostoc sp. S51]